MADNNRGTRGGRDGRMPLRAPGRGVRGRGRGGRRTPTTDSPSSDQPMTDAETIPLPSPSVTGPSSSTPASSPSAAGSSSSTNAPSLPSVGPSSSRSNTQRIVIGQGPGNLEMSPPTLTIKEVSKIIKSKFDSPWPTYSAVHKDTKDLWWGEFKKKFTWEPRHEWEIKKAFDHRVSCLIKASMNHIRYGKSKGNWIAAHIRAQLEEYFANNPDFQKKSAIGRQNRVADAGASAYIGGRISTGEYYDMMTQEMGRPPTAIEILAKTKVKVRRMSERKVP